MVLTGDKEPATGPSNCVNSDAQAIWYEIAQYLHFFCSKLLRAMSRFDKDIANVENSHM